jgi:hypothetical protein
MAMAYIYANEKGKKTFLHERKTTEGNIYYSAFVGKFGGDYRTWKTLERAQKEMENKGWKKIGEREVKEA